MQMRRVERERDAFCVIGATQALDNGTEVEEASKLIDEVEFAVK